MSETQGAATPKFSWYDTNVKGRWHWWGFLVLVVLVFWGAMSISVMPQDFEGAVVAFINSKQDRALVKDVFKDTPYKGSHICISYEPELTESAIDLRDELNGFFPGKTAQVSAVLVKLPHPTLLFAFDTADGILIAESGHRNVFSGIAGGKNVALDKPYTVAAVQDGKFQPKRASTCFDYNKAVMRLGTIDERAQGYVLVTSGEEGQ